MSNYSSLEDSCRQPSPVSMTTSCYDYWALHKRRYQRAHKCVSSKAALIILVWVFLALFTFFITSKIFFVIFHYKVSPTSYEFYYISSLSYCIYPVAGYLADIKFGRYKTVIRSLYLSILLLLILSVLVLILLFAPTGNKLATYSLVIIISVAGLLLLMSFISVNANFIQFGIDQLHDSPEGHQSLFIHWYIWIFQLVSSSIQVASTLLTYNKLQYFIVSFIPAIILLLLSVVVAKRRENWFHIDHARPNPYRLVYKLTKFAHRHKVPIRRSAFTFCEDDVPSGLDLGKTKYGGPFSTEEVEDVKVFYGILKILVALGPVTALISMNDQSYFIDIQMSEIISFLYKTISGLLIVILIPLYIWLIRPFVYYYLPSMLKRIGFGVIVMALAMLCTALILETAYNLKYADINCNYRNIDITFNFSVDSDISVYYVNIIPKCLYSLSILLFQIAYYEFICSQSPNSMKGFLIGLSFAINGAFQVIFSILLTIFSHIQFSTPHLSCGLVYYLICISLTAASLLLYVYFARKYQPRKRDEICPVYRYAEEYYSKEDMNNKE